MAEKKSTLPEPDYSKLTPTQQRTAGFVKTAKDDAPKVEHVEDLYTRIEMEVPKAVIKGVEYSYAWLAVDNLDEALHSGSKWEIVTRNNHSHAPERFFGLDGAITYKGQNILAFCYRAVRDAENEAIVRAYNQKTDRMVATQEQVPEGEAARVDPGSTGKAVEAAIVDPAEAYDFDSPN